MRLRIFSAAAALVLTWAAATRAQTYNCFGDSLTFGRGGSNSDSYLGPLRDYLVSEAQSATMINSGVRGESTPQGLARLGSALDRGGSHVLLMMGTNDVNRWAEGMMTPSDTQSNLNSMVSAIQSRGMTAVIATVPPRRGDRTDPNNIQTDRLNDIISSVARSHGALLADVHSKVAQALPYSDMWLDSIHLADAGYPLMAEAFAAVLTGVAASSIDITPPLTAEVTPSPFTRSAPLNVTVKLTMVDLGRGIDTDTARMEINGAEVMPDIAVVAGGRIEFTYPLPEPLSFGERVDVLFELDDTATPPNSAYLDYEFFATGGNGTNGDIDHSGRIDGRDLGLMAGAFGARVGQPRYNRDADIDLNGVVDGLDLTFLADGFGERR